MGALTPVLQLLLLITALLLPKVVWSCDEIPECQTISVQVTTSQIAITGLAAGFFLHNITYINGSAIQASDNSWNNAPLISFVSGTQYVIYYGNDSISCCHNVTTKPMSVKSLQIGAVTSYSVSLTWSKPDEYQTSYRYRVQTNVSSSASMINDTIVTSESATIMNLTPGETYTFMVYTRAADNSTESDPMSNTTCTDPGQVSTITMNNYHSVDVLGASWIKPAGNVVNYTVSLTGAINKMTHTASPQVNFTGLLAGREYNVTVQTVSGSCSQTSAPVTEATYPTPPGTLSSITITTKNLTLSWLEPVNMTGVNKTYNISYGIYPSTTLSATSPTTNVTLQSLISGTNYSITLVTVGVRGYQSSPVTTSVYTKPMSVKSLQIGAVTSYSVSLTWSQPDEYQTSYRYRVQTNVTSSASMINDTIVTSESATIMNLTPGETYIFMVYTRAADNITESDPVSNTTCSVPGQVSNITMNNYQSVDDLGASWTKPAEKVDNYTVSVTGAINKTTQTTSTQVNFTGLLPGREYNVTVQTVSGSCSQTSAPVTEATYPSPSGTLSFITITTKNLTLSWSEPVNMAGVNKSYNISYGIYPSTNLSVTSLTTNVTLQSLRSGTNYSITVVTVGVREYQSSPVTTSVYTKPISVTSLQIGAVTSYTVSLTWSKPDEYQMSYSYRVQTFNSSATMINNTIVTSELATIMNLRPGETYTFMVYTRAADKSTESDPMSNTTCTVPGQVSNITMNNYHSVDVLGASWIKPAGKVDNYTVSLTGAINKTTQTTDPQVNFTGLLPGREYNVTVQPVSGSCSQTSAPVTEATYPTPPGTLSFTTITTKNLTLSWLEPVNMAGVNKSYNISYGIYPSANLSVTSPTTNVTLQSLISGTNYSITVVTVGVRWYQSSPVTTSGYTKPISVKSLQIGAVTSYSVSLTWSKPDEYQTSYSYRVQTFNSSATMINQTIVTNESATIMNLTPGKTYTFMVYTRAADNITESDPVSNTTCTVPGQVSNITMNNYKSVDVLGASWIKPEGKVDNYTVSVTGAINKITQTTSMQVNFTGLLPGREYNVTVQTVSGSCSQTSAPVTEATYPTPPGTLSFIMITTKNLTLSWLEPVNMTGVNKTYNISYGIYPSTNLSVTSSTTNVTLQSLISGTNYSITVVTVGVRGYQSSPVTTSGYTKPISVKSLQIGAVTSYSVSLTWSKPDEYQTSYTYRVQTNVTSSATIENNTIVTSESATIMNLTPGETYTFMVYTRAADNITESDPVSNTTCTVPGQVSNITMNNYKSVDVLGASWIKPAGKVDNYTVSLTGAINKTTQTTDPQVNFTGLLPGREYNVTVQTVSGSCSQTSAPVTEATYPTPPGTLSSITITTKNLTLSWSEPVNMTGVNKTYNISYGIYPSATLSVTSPTTNVTLQSLISGTNYSITVVTVGVRGYQSSPVTTSVYTKPISVKSLQISNVTSYSVSLMWSKPDEYQTSYGYRVKTFNSSTTMIYDTIVTSESATIMNLTPGETYTFMVYTRAADNRTESDPVSNTTCTVPGQVSTITMNNYHLVDVLGASWIKPAGKVDNYTVSVTGAINKITQTTSMQVNFTGLLPGREYNVTVLTVSGSCSQTSAPVTEATYPTPPGTLSFILITTKNLTLSWPEPVNMTGVNKTYNVSYGIYPSTNLSVTSPTTSVTLQSLISGTNYSITVVTVGVRGYQSSPVTTSVYTKPISVKSLLITNLTTYSVSLTWSRPDEYQSSYTYRIQTNVTSSASMINNIIVTSESATIMNLTSGETYTFMVYTRAADNSTESDPVSLLPICTGAEQVSITSVVNNLSVSSLVVNWTPATAKAKVDYYNAILSGVIQKVSNTTTQAIFTGLVPGTEYTATVQIVSGNCNQSSLSVTNATYPTPPSNLIISTVGTKNLTLSWSETVNITGVNKTYNISYGISPSTTLSVTSPTTSVTLQNLISGTNYSITVVTVGVRGYQSSPVTTSVYTKPMSVKSLQISNVTSYSVSLAWSKPEEYQTSYSYRVQTFNSSATMINDTIVTSESATIMNLTPGETYTFMVYTRAADNSTESDPVSNTTCTIPGQVSTITMNNYQSVDVLGASWIKPAGKVDNYTVSLTGAINKTTQTTDPQVNFTGLLPGREYNVTVQPVSGSCSQTSAPAPVTEATYPTPPGTLSFITITAKSLTLSWLEPVNMAGVNKTYNISYGIYPSTTLSVTSPTTNVTLQSLISGTNYSITVVTVGVRGYQSSPVTTSVYTKPMSVKSLQIGAVTTYSVSLTWSKPDEYQMPYRYRVQTNVTSSTTMINDTIVASESATIMNLTPGETYTFMVYTRAADNSTESDAVLNTTCTNPGAVNDFNCAGQFNSTSLTFTWSCPEGLYTGFTIIATNKTSTTNNVSVAQCNSDPYNYTMKDLNFYTNYTVRVITLTSCSRSSMVILTTCQTWKGSPLPEPSGSVSKITSTYYTLQISFTEFDSTNGPIDGYAIIVSRSNGNGKPSQNDLLNTYTDFNTKKTDAYVATIIQKNKSSQRSSPAATQTVTIGDDSNDPPYKNGALDPGTPYWVSIAGFTELERDPNGYISPKSLCSFTDYQEYKTDDITGMIVGAVVGSILGAIVIGVIVFFIVKMRRKRETKNPRVQLPSIKRSQTMSTNSFISHFDRQKADCNLGFSEEYEKLSSVGTKQTKLFSEEVENREKNRYTNVLPYDVSRVVLSSLGNPTEDYINANYIPGYNSTKEYIAAQGPLPRTVNDFWRMIWEKNVRAVVMLTKCVELGKVKCEEYWPQRSARIYGNLSISMNDENVLQDWTTRDFTLVDMKTRQSKVVRHFHFTAWPDHGVPKATGVLIEFRNLVREYMTNDDSMHSPIVVHCSAGVGRTGTLIALDRIMKQIETESQIDVYGVVYDLRMHRGLMVQTESQYVFLNQCALDIIKAPRMNDPDLIYQNMSAISQNMSTSSFKKTNF
ncbi:receptor-type tyrosine-protein phosphatase beta-like [Dendrobates tinctorius]|uniref:receptor-type tyrosine-protein phosphatase beta-like n=1 Tax=Dendrobates tinctorius TaxID=92724 RepID=UPI003CCA12D4